MTFPIYNSYTELFKAKEVPQDMETEVEKSRGYFSTGTSFVLMNPSYISSE